MLFAVPVTTARIAMLEHSKEFLCRYRNRHLTTDQMDALAGTDVLLALTGEPSTTPLDDLKYVIETIKPKVVIPMHYRTPGPRFFMMLVTDFTALFPKDSIT